MKKVFTSKDFQEYFGKTDSLVASEIAQQKFEEFIKEFLKKPVNNEGTGNYYNGYLDCLNDLMGSLEK